MTRSPLFNFALGLVFGLTAGTAGAVHVLTARIQKQAVEVGESFDRLNQQVQQIQQKAAESEQRAQTCEAAAGKMNADLQQRDFRDRWYTLVYEPGTAGPPESMFTMLDAIRPGLGTLLSKAQQTPPPGLVLQMVLDGYVKAELRPQNVHLVYTLTPPAAAPAVTQ